MAFKAILTVMTTAVLLAFFGMLGTGAATVSWTAVSMLLFACFTHFFLRWSIGLINSFVGACRMATEAREEHAVENVDVRLQALQSSVDAIRREQEHLASCYEMRRCAIEDLLNAQSRLVRAELELTRYQKMPKSWQEVCAIN